MPADDPQLKARVAAIRAGQTAQQPESGGVGSYLDNIGRRVASGATFGFADEFAAKMASMTGIGGKRGQFEQNLAMERQKIKHSSNQTLCLRLFQRWSEQLQAQ